MQAVLTCDDIKRVEVGLTRVGVSVSELMHRAGLAVAQELLAYRDQEGIEEGLVVVLCGLGNNGGDGWVCAEALHAAQIPTMVVSPVAVSELPGDLVRQVAQSAERAGVPVVVGPSRDELSCLLKQAHLVVDAMLGTGFHGAVRTPFDIWIHCANACAAPIISIDVPSGLSAETGTSDNAMILANLTVTMLALKPGLIADKGRDACGQIVVAPLAEQSDELVQELGPLAYREDLAHYADCVPPTSSAVDKYSRGSVLVVGGSRDYPGAVVLAARAALRSGAGYVRVAVPESIAPIVQSHLVEIPVTRLPEEPEGTLANKDVDALVRLAEHFSCVLVGPGMRVTAGTTNVLLGLMSTKTPMVVDADGLNALSRLAEGNILQYPEIVRRQAPLILTPHRGELGRLIGRGKHRPTSLVEQIACARLITQPDASLPPHREICVVAKSSAPCCVWADQVILPKPGSFSLASEGSGDVLGGMIASTMAQLLERGELYYERMARMCAYVCEAHGLAGRMAAELQGSRAVIAGDIVDMLGQAFDVMAEDINHAQRELLDAELREELQDHEAGEASSTDAKDLDSNDGQQPHTTLSASSVDEKDAPNSAGAVLEEGPSAGTDEKPVQASSEE